MIGKSLLTAAALSLAAAGTALASSPASGVWLTGDDHGQVEVYDCGQALCGKVLTSDILKAHPEQKDERNKDAALRARSVKGLEFMTGFTGGPKEWKGGKLYRPQDGGTYSGELKLLDANTLKLTGCLVFPLCQSQTWTRLK
jgi:uncharacterized protein (DUF2147 family)